jgi:4-amino-4-deoxy-L-arabinose transferase-like glycosyltransferase
VSYGWLRRPGYGRKLALITAFGAALRLALLARQPLGVDEDFTAVVVGRPLGEMLGVVGRDSAPPLFYVLEWLVAQIAGGPAALRLVPALAGIALVPLLAALARRVRGDAAGLWAAAFAALLPTTLLASENARMYSLAGTLVVAATLLLWRAVERPDAGRPDVERPAVEGRSAGLWVAYAVVAAAAVWTDYFAAVALAGVLVAIVWLRPGRRTLVAAGSATAIAFAGISPWLVFAQAQLEHAGQGFWIPPLSVGSLAGTFGQLFAGPPVDSGVPGRDILLALQIVAVAAGSIALAAVAFDPAGWRRFEPGARRAAVFMLIACSGVLALAAVSPWRPILEARYAGVMWLPLFALAGVGLAVVPRRLAAALLVAVAVPTLALGGVITHPETASLLPEIESRAGPHDLVAADPNHYLALLAQGSPAVRARLHVLAASDPPWYFGTAAYPPDAVLSSVPADVAASGGRIYYVADPGSAPPSLPPGYRQAEQRCAVGACLTTYAPNG